MNPLLFALALCNGEIVSTIDIRAHPPSAASAAAEAWDKASEISGVRFAVTRPSVVRAYLRMREGERCTELDRRESERLLRAQPFIASAAIRAYPDGPGRVRLRVDVVDEPPGVAGGSVSHGTLASLHVGSQNIGGLGLVGVVGFSRGFAYRTGFGIEAVQYGAFGRPDYVSLDAQREQHGDRLVFEVAEPFLTELQRNAFHAGGADFSGYSEVLQRTGTEVALFTRRASWDAGWVTRLGTPTPGRTVGVLGAIVMGEDIRSGGKVVIVSDSGLIAAPDSALLARYPSFGVARAAVISGVRRLRYITVSGFDALHAEQDIGIGVQLGVLAGPSIWASRGTGDVFAAGDLYAGVGDLQSFFAVRLLGEVRGNHESKRWDGEVASMRLSWYGTTGEWTSVATIEASALHGLAFPAQLSFRDPDGGVRGFSGAIGAGGERVVTRFESRVRFPHITSRADVAAAVFADAGKLWASDAPYGVTSPIRSALGVSLLAAFPANSKRTYRVDFAIPLNPERGGARFELRLGTSDRTRGIWSEPRDVARARTGAMPATLLKW